MTVFKLRHEVKSHNEYFLCGRFGRKKLIKNAEPVQKAPFSMTEKAVSIKCPDTYGRRAEILSFAREMKSDV